MCCILYPSFDERTDIADECASVADECPFIADGGSLTCIPFNLGSLSLQFQDAFFLLF
ncbi:MAG: hypothetical protein J5671_08265 [Bacteroidaceae bacterium]|nr:hypothetical protein [Bacteroidaceae bacterium]